MTDFTPNLAETATFTDYLQHPDLQTILNWIKDEGAHVYQTVNLHDALAPGADWKSQVSEITMLAQYFTGVGYALQKLVDDAPDTPTAIDDARAAKTFQEWQSQVVVPEWKVVETRA